MFKIPNRFSFFLKKLSSKLISSDNFLLRNNLQNKIFTFIQFLLRLLQLCLENVPILVPQQKKFHISFRRIATNVRLMDFVVFFEVNKLSNKPWMIPSWKVGNLCIADTNFAFQLNFYLLI